MKVDQIVCDECGALITEKRGDVKWSRKRPNVVMSVRMSVVSARESVKDVMIAGLPEGNMQVHLCDGNCLVRWIDKRADEADKVVQKDIADEMDARRRGPL